LLHRSISSLLSRPFHNQQTTLWGII
jgi:hypothetical protein